MDINLKNILLTGIGSVAYTYEKATQMIDTLVKKGELTLNQGKELNEELKRTLEHKNKQDNENTEDIKNIINEAILPIKQNIEDIKVRLNNLEKND